PAWGEKHNSFLRLFKKKGCKEESMTKVRLYAIGTSTTLESNKSHVGMANPSPSVRQTGNIQGLLVIRGVCRRSVASGCAQVKYRCRCRSYVGEKSTHWPRLLSSFRNLSQEGVR